MTYGIVDVGSNTIRLCIYDVTDKKITPMFSNKTTAGLIDYVNDGKLSAEGIDKACEVISLYRDMTKTAGIPDLHVFATASLRNISNSKKATREIIERTGVNVDVLSGKEEAMLDFHGASIEKDMTHGIMVDIGGGSTEIVSYNNGAATNASSMEFGSLYMFKNHVAHLFPTKDEKKTIEDIVTTELKNNRILKNKNFDHMIGIGGTIRAVKKLSDYRFGNSNEDIIYTKNLNTLISETQMETQEDEKTLLRKILRVAPDRVHTLIPGMLILGSICSYCGCKEIEISHFGVREGYLLDKVINNE